MEDSTKLLKSLLRFNPSQEEGTKGMKKGNLQKYKHITTSIYSSYIQLYIEDKYKKTFNRLSKWIQKDMDERMMPEIKGQFEIRVRANLEASKKV